MSWTRIEIGMFAGGCICGVLIAEGLLAPLAAMVVAVTVWGYLEKWKAAESQRETQAAHAEILDMIGDGCEAHCGSGPCSCIYGRIRELLR